MKNRKAKPKRRITIILGHPDSSGERFNAALAAVYETAARDAGHEVRVINVAELRFSSLRTKKEWEKVAPCEAIRDAQEDIAWAQHLLILFPLWLGGMPALLKAFFEQAMRPGFAVPDLRQARGIPKGLLRGRSARIVVTMGMPALMYRVFFRAHSLRSLERNILGFCGIAPISETLIGQVETCSPRQRGQWLQVLRALGAKGA